MFFAISHVFFMMTIRLVLFNLCELASINLHTYIL